MFYLNLFKNMSDLTWDFAVLKLIFGGVILTVIATILAIANNFLNINDKYIKWKKHKNKLQFKATYKINNPDFKFSLNYLSNPEPGKCILQTTVLNVSKDIKYIDCISYNFENPSNIQNIEPSLLFVNGEKWPKRIEHGERFATSVDFQSHLINTLFQYWKKGIKVYATCKSTTGDFILSNSIDYDLLVTFLAPINESYKNLSIILSQKSGGSQRDIEVSLWQLQIFGRITVHITKQLQQNNIPIVQYLIDKHGLINKKDLWNHWYRDLEEKKIHPSVIEGFLYSQFEK